MGSFGTGGGGGEVVGMGPLELLWALGASAGLAGSFGGSAAGGGFSLAGAFLAGASPLAVKVKTFLVDILTSVTHIIYFVNIFLSFASNDIYLNTHLCLFTLYAYFAFCLETNFQILYIRLI